MLLKVMFVASSELSHFSDYSGLEALQDTEDRNYKQQNFAVRKIQKFAIRAHRQSSYIL